MSGLLLPRHQMASHMKAKNAAAAENIKKTSVHRLDSDDFITPIEVLNQIDMLQAYIELRREEELDYSLPHPTGWKLMVLVLTIPEKSTGGVIIVDDAKEARSLASPQGVVVAMGSQTYNDPDRFDEPWVAVGDRITYIKYDASMFQIANGQRLGFLNDTQPVSVIDNGWEIPT